MQTESRMGQPIRPGERWDDSPEPNCECGAKSFTDCEECWRELCSECAVPYGRKYLCAKCAAKFEEAIP